MDARANRYGLGVRWRNLELNRHQHLDPAPMLALANAGMNNKDEAFGWLVQGKVYLPLPIDCRSNPRCHCATRSRAGIRSGHRIVKWFKASRQ